jgi:hypothetical protein
MTDAPQGHVRTVTLGVLLEEERLDNPWQVARWRVAGVVLDPPHFQATWAPFVGGGLSGGGGALVYHAGNHEAELHRKETAAYKINLEGGEPSVYVVLAEAEDVDADAPVAVTLVTLSPDEAQAYGNSGFETVERVAMPPELVPVVAAFVAEHHAEEVFVKRQRSRKKEEAELFGQEPIFSRQRRQNSGGGDNGADGAA